MSKRLRVLLMCSMVTALFFGFLHLFVEGGSIHNFERLHIFLFNLVSGGTILIHFSEGEKRLSAKGTLFFLLSSLYALLAWAELYGPAILTALMLAILVDSVRVRLFSLLPMEFFDSQVPVSRKFHQASLLCLSMGLAISGLVILNNKYFGWIHLEKLKLDTFFLGFSFPLSLITMSVIFSFMTAEACRVVDKLKNVGFWNVNLGVIIFFLLILLEKLIPQLVVTTVLFIAVMLIYFLYRNLGERDQQKHFLSSGMLFLLYTAVTGILYIALEFDPGYVPENTKYLLRLHSFASLYGWNLSGLAVICRKDEFPLSLSSTRVISVHWVTAALLAPLGTFYRPFAVCALACWVFILYNIMFSNGEPLTLGSETVKTVEV